jgi:gas vesicle protein
MKRTINFFLGAMIGGLIGATVAVLIAPYSGSELRAEMMTRAEKIRTEVAQAATERRRELERQLATLRAPQDYNQ